MNIRPGPILRLEVLRSLILLYGVVVMNGAFISIGVLNTAKHTWLFGNPIEVN